MNGKLFSFTLGLSCMLWCNSASAQAVLERVKSKVNQRVNSKVDKTIDKGLDELEAEAKNKNSKAPDLPSTAKQNGSAGQPAPTDELEYNAKYDFIPGEKIMALEDFSATATGDFPLRWNTNGTAEVVTLTGKEGSWLKIGEQGVFLPEFIKSLPDNFTFEFDLAVNHADYLSPFCVNVANLKQPGDFADYAYLVSMRPEHAVHLEFLPASNISPAQSKLVTGKDGIPAIDNSVNFKAWDISKNKFAHVSLWRQKTRLRVYINGEKIWDSPRAFESTGNYNAITFAFYGAYDKQKDYYLLSNLRLAVGAADTRNKLLTEGKFVTSGINFDVNADKLRPDAFGIIKEIAEIMKEDPSVKLKITGHTDSDGEEAKNMELSKKRAAAVREALMSRFGIDAARLQTDGKGESLPVSSNTTPEGKAQNRRVEFVKF